MHVKRRKQSVPYVITSKHWAKHLPKNATADKDVTPPKKDYAVPKSHHAHNHPEDGEEAEHEVVDIPEGR